ncbi:DUF2905 family protein [Thermosyntropha sp.]|uniref:DUF2905 family protein n=1 Tax=Thermosyntropha sp. TaxID=2740820 RepID=UPI0025D80073|nr:DUF2905 family protein [Thermosyntropha sp.]MBO8159937.1 DUF2905 domain-containing protein [Thermosyntropha sp.]
MNGFEGIARLLIISGLLLLFLGAIFYLMAKLGGGSFFRLPGDIYVKKEDFVFYFPITTFLLLSLILTLLFNLIFRR